MTSWEWECFLDCWRKLESLEKIPRSKLGFKLESSWCEVRVLTTIPLESHDGFALSVIMSPITALIACSPNHWCAQPVGWILGKVVFLLKDICWKKRRLKNSFLWHCGLFLPLFTYFPHSWGLCIRTRTHTCRSHSCRRWDTADGSGTRTSPLHTAHL